MLTVSMPYLRNIHVLNYIIILIYEFICITWGKLPIFSPFLPRCRKENEKTTQQIQVPRTKLRLSVTNLEAGDSLLNHQYWADSLLKCNHKTEGDSFRGPRFTSQHTCGSSQLSITTFQGIQCYLLASLDISIHVIRRRAWRQTPIHIK